MIRKMFYVSMVLSFARKIVARMTTGSIPFILPPAPSVENVEAVLAFQCELQDGTYEIYTVPVPARRFAHTVQLEALNAYLFRKYRDELMSMARGRDLWTIVWCTRRKKEQVSFSKLASLAGVPDSDIRKFFDLMDRIVADYRNAR